MSWFPFFFFFPSSSFAFVLLYLQRAVIYFALMNKINTIWIGFLGVAGFIHKRYSAVEFMQIKELFFLLLFFSCTNLFPNSKCCSESLSTNQVLQTSTVLHQTILGLGSRVCVLVNIWLSVKIKPLHKQGVCCPCKQEASTPFHLPPPPVQTNTVVSILSQLVADKSYIMTRVPVCF